MKKDDGLAELHAASLEAANSAAHIAMLHATSIVETVIGPGSSKAHPSLVEAAMDFAAKVYGHNFNQMTRSKHGSN